jgi:hypothetical protein
VQSAEEPEGATGGPYATEAACEASICGAIATGCCEGVVIPRSLLVTVTDKTGDYVTLLPDSFLITWDGAYWSNTTLLDCGGPPTQGFSMSCIGTSVLDFCVTEFDICTPDSGSCDPFVVVWIGRTIYPLSCPAGTATFTVTEVP